MHSSFIFIKTSVCKSIFFFQNWATTMTWNRFPSLNCPIQAMNWNKVKDVCNFSCHHCIYFACEICKLPWTPTRCEIFGVFASSCSLKMRGKDTVQSRFSDNLWFNDIFFNLLHKIIRFSEIMRFSDSFCGDHKCH